MINSTFADISVFEGLQNQAHENMGLSGMSAFNSTPQKKKSNIRRAIGKAALVSAVTIAALTGKGAMPPNARPGGVNRHAVVARNARNSTKSKQQ
jgi:SMC interacting uncharacterized protein involved in chromosome segregation